MFAAIRLASPRRSAVYLLETTFSWIAFCLLRQEGNMVRIVLTAVASLFNNQKNSTVNLVPWLLSTRSIRNSPPICSTKD
jgi:hypothetical protein